MKGMEHFLPICIGSRYVSDESGKSEIYVKPSSCRRISGASNASGKWQVSVKGGDGAGWRDDGKAIYYIVENKIMKAEVRETGSSFEVLKVTQYMDLQYRQQIVPMDMSSDGKLILGQITPPPE